MRKTLKRTACTVLTSAVFLGACGGHSQNPSSENAAGAPVTPAATNAPPAPASGTAAATADTTPAHHSKLGGAVVGAAAGHVVGGTRGAIAGAIIGAEVQHHRNKVAAERARP